MRKIGKLNCLLCMNERLQILRAHKREKYSKTKRIIYSSSKLCWACRHKSKFHRHGFCNPPSTDEGLPSLKKSDVSTSVIFLPSSDFSDFESNLSLQNSARACTLTEKDNIICLVDLWKTQTLMLCNN